MKTPTLALAALALSGCVLDNYASPEFYGVCANPAPDSTTGFCTYSSTCGTYMSNYWYDPTSPYGLVVPIEMFNQLPNNADVTALRVNTNDAVIEQWEFDYAVGNPGSYVTFQSASIGTTVVVPAASHTVALVPVVPPGLAVLLPYFVVNVRAVGRYLDDRTFETAPFGVQVYQATYVPPTLSSCTGYVAVCPQPGQASTPGCVTG